VLTNIAWSGGAPVAPFTSGALGRDHIVLVAADRLLLVERGPAAARVDKTLPLSFVPHDVALSPSARFLFVADRARLEVWEVAGGRRIIEVWSKDSRRTGIAGTFAEHSGRELLLWNDEGAALHGQDLETRAAAFSCVASTFRFAATPLVVGGHLIALGFFAGESKESLASVELDRLLTAPHTVSDHFQRKHGLQDYTYRLCAGPAGGDRFVAFRDPKDDEDEALEEEGPAYRDVWGFHGLYVRRVDGTLVERIPWNDPIESFASLAASPSRIVAACDDGIHLLDHGGAAVSPPIDARWLATSPDGGEVLLWTREGALALL
jgi:hypothetical protein